MRSITGWSVVDKDWQKSSTVPPVDVAESMLKAGVCFSREQARKLRGRNDSVVQVRIYVKSEKGN